MDDKLNTDDSYEEIVDEAVESLDQKGERGVGIEGAGSVLEGEKRPGGIQGRKSVFGSFWFYCIFSLAVLNAGIYVYFRRVLKNKPVLTMEMADHEITERFGEDAEELAPFYQIMNDESRFKGPGDPKLSKVVDSLNSVLNKGGETEEFFDIKNFRSDGNGIFYVDYGR